MSEKALESANRTQVAEATGTQIIEIDLQYIAERENKISRYSDKLRESVQKIFQQFNSDVCRVCGNTSDAGQHSARTHCAFFKRDENKTVEQQIEEIRKEGGMSCGHGSALNATQLEERGKELVEMAIRDLKEAHEFKAGIDVSFNFKDDKYFYITDQYEYRLCIKDTFLAIEKLRIESEYTCDGQLLSGVPAFADANPPSRETLKALVNSGRIVTFLHSVAEQLKQKEEEYQQVSALAEKLVKAL